MRHLRALIAVALAVVLGGTGLVTAQGAAAATPREDVDTIITRLQEYYLGQGDEIIIANGIYLARTSDALDYAASQEPDGSWDDVDYADRTSSANGSVWSAYTALYRMLAMAQAYRDPEADGFEDPALVTAVERSLEYWDVADPGNTNWWETEVGESIAMGRLSIFLGDVLDASAFDVSLRHNTGKLDPVGANGAWRTTNYLFEAIATYDLEKIALGFDTMVQTVAVDSSGTIQEAVQPDASFWAHGAQLYSEGYGMALFTNVALWADVARGTGLAFSRQHLDTIAFYIISGTRWMIRGEIGLLYLNYRQPKTVDGITSHASEFIEPLTRMVRTDPLYASAYRAVLDGIRGTTTTNGVTGNRYFWRSELSSHLREEYGIITRLNSSRTVGSEYRSTFRPEVGNEIVWNSAGATAIQVTNREYLDLGPTFDWFHYPGVTAPYVKEQTRGSTGNGGSFTGGVSDGTYGASVYSLDRAATKAKKSYYYFDDEMVALGAGITSTSTAAVHTTVNQAVAQANASVDGVPVAAGSDAVAVDDPAWAYNDHVGYVFPDDARVLVSDKAQTGSWLGEDAVSRDAFTLYFDHGVTPADAGYQYVVLPAAAPAEVEAYAAAPAVEVLRNDASVQAVRHAGLQRTMATFYQAGTLDLGDGRTLEVSQPSIVLLDESGPAPVASVANPSQPGLVVRVALTGPDTAAYGVFGLGSGASLGKTVTAALVASESGTSPYAASSAQEGHGAALAGDGDEATSWRPAGDGTAWLTRQLDHGSLVTGVTVTWGDDFARRFLLQTSLDGVTWTDQKVVQGADGTATRVDIAPTAAGLVRLLLLESAHGSGYDVRELAVDASVNVALGAAVSVSGTSTGAGGNLTDGSMETRWSGNLSDSAWARVDLGSVQPIGTVRLWWEASYAKQYKVQVSDDGSTWRDVYTTPAAGSDGGLDVIGLDEQARYVRMQTVQRSTSAYGVSLWELEVFADDAIAHAPTVPAGPENLALGRPVTADSQYNATLAPTNAVDGNLTTRWASLRQDAPYTTERWLQVELDGLRTVNQVALTWESATSNDFRVEGSTDGRTWQQLARVQKTSAELKNVVDFPDTEVRYLRVIGLPVTKYGLSLYELEVYGGYKLACEASPLTVTGGSTAVLAATITPYEADDVLTASSLDDTVATVVGTPRVGADGRIEVDLAAGTSGSTSVLITHAQGDEVLWCGVSIAVDTAALAEAVGRADALESERYTAASWAPLLSALETAKARLASPSTQAEIDASVAALGTAVAGLVELPPVDETAPVVSGSVEGRVVTVVASDEGGSGVASVEYRLGESGDWLVYDGPVTVPGADAVTVQFRATDGAGNVSEVGSVLVEAVAVPDETAPVVSGSVDGRVVTVVASDEGGSGVASVEYRLGESGDWSAYTAAVVVPGLDAVTVQFRATDGAGNVSEVGSVLVEAVAVPDETAPVVSGSVEGRVVTVVASDEGGSGVASVEYRLGESGDWLVYVGPVTVPGADAVTVQFRATDGAGNVSEVGSVQVEEVVVPDVTIVASATTVRPGDPVTITLTHVPGDEVEVGIASVYRRLATAPVVDGTVTVTVQIPADLEAGTHHLQARAADGTVLVELPIEVLALDPAPAVDPAETPAVTAPPGTLPRTGADPRVPLAVAFLLLAAGTAITLRVRRRQV